MITLNDYLYSGNTILKILHKYEEDLRADVRQTHNAVDLAHCNFLLQMIGVLEHNDFLTSQAQRIHSFYQYMTREYPQLAFTFKGRIKSLIRSEAKFNGYIIECISNHYREHQTLPASEALRQRLGIFRDLIAYRIVISLPRCHLGPDQDLESEELKYLYRIANQLPAFLEEQGFTPEPSGMPKDDHSPLNSDVRPYYRDYIASPKPLGYRSLHITFYDNEARCHIEVQLRTKSMDDHASIGPADHEGYEKRQQQERTQRDSIPLGLSREFDEAWQRHVLLQQMDVSKLDVNMFYAVSESIMNDGCGLYRGRLITPFEHLSRFQND